jgi:hypothetical protein
MAVKEAPMEELSYSIGEKDDVIVVLFSGKIREQEIALLEKLPLELTEKAQPIIILDFKKVFVFQPEAYRALGQVLKTIRAANKIGGISDLHVDFKNTMLHAGILRESEVFRNVGDAWRNLSRLYVALQECVVPANVPPEQKKSAA